MLAPVVGLTLLLATCTTSALILPRDADAYAPTANVSCPNQNLVRTFSASNQSLHTDELSFIAAREAKAADAWGEWIGDGSTLGYESGALNLREHQPRVGIAMSGGSFRASLYGAGVLNALDARNASSKAAGTGGLLQVASYITGLSGGSWLVSSLYSNGFPMTNELVFGNKDIGWSGWLLDLDLFFPGGIDPGNSVDFYGSLKRSVKSKAARGVFTSLTDTWARALSYHMLNGTTRENFFYSDADVVHGAGQLWSGIANIPAYRDHDTPFPIIVVDSRPAKMKLGGDTELEFLVYEFSPVEFASYDPALSAAMQTRYMGSDLYEGKPTSSNGCMEGLDETGFVFATSSSLFNVMFDTTSDGAESTLGVLGDLYESVLDDFQTRNKDVANWRNPFKGISRSTFTETAEDWLSLVDGGLNGENIPLGPLFVKERGLDVIVAVDASADSDDDFPTCMSLLHTDERIDMFLKESHQTFPPVPVSAKECISTGVNLRPTFFGCNPENTTEPEYPLLIYLPNSPPLTGENPVTNSGTFKLSYTEKHQHLFLDQVHKNTIGGFIPNSNNPDVDFGRCLQCAAVDRARMLSWVDRSAFCADCFAQYCYDPLNPPQRDAIPDRKRSFVDPDPQDVHDFIERNKSTIIIAGLVCGLLIILITACCIWCCCCRRRKIVQKTYLQLTPTASRVPLNPQQPQPAP